MSGPFSNSTDGDVFTVNRCNRCVHREQGTNDPCNAFTPAYFGEWPSILRQVSATEANPVGVECDRFEAEMTQADLDEPEPAAVREVDPRLADCWLPVVRRWRAVKARDVIKSAGQLGQVEWISYGSEWRSAGRPQAKVVGYPPFPVDLDAEVTVLAPSIERDCLATIGETFPAAHGIADCADHEHSQLNEEGAA